MRGLRGLRGVRGRQLQGRKGSEGEGPTHQGLGLLDVFVSEEKLSIQVTQVNGIKINNVDLAEPGHNEVFEELASDAAGAY